jgi:hypothetical protein
MKRLLGLFPEIMEFENQPKIRMTDFGQYFSPWVKGLIWRGFFFT